MDRASRFFEKNGVYLEIGVMYTKLGFIGEGSLRSMIPTPKSLFKVMHELQDNKVFLADCFRSEELLEWGLEEFLHQIFFFELIINPKERQIFYCENLVMPVIFHQKIAQILFNRFEVPSIYFLNQNSLPLYTTGVQSGIVLDVGYMETQVTAINEGFAIPLGPHSFCESGGMLVNKTMKKFIQADNTSTSSRQIDNCLIENIKFKYINVPLLKQFQEYFSSESNIEMMKQSIVDYQLNKQQIKLSYYMRMMSGNVLFGNVDDEQPNIAYTLLKSLLQIDFTIRKKLCQNIVLSGGTCLMPKFTQRLKQELIELIENNSEFSQLKGLINYISFAGLLFPPNTLNFIGASIIGNLNGIESFMVTKEKYAEQGDQVLGRNSASFIFNNRKPEELKNDDIKKPSQNLTRRISDIRQQFSNSQQLLQQPSFQQ